MEMNMREILKMGNLKDLELRKKIKKYIKEISLMIYMRVKELKNIQMEKDMKGNFMKDYFMEREHGFTLIILNQKEFGKKEKKMVLPKDI